MRETQIQTPMKELPANRRSKSISDQTKKPLKNIKKSLNTAFESPGVVSSESSIESSLITSDEDLLLIPETSPSSESVDPVTDLTPLSSTVTFENYKECTGSNNSSGIPQSSDVKVGFVEAEIVVKYLRETQMQLVNATDVDIRYKKLLDAVINTVVEEFCELPEDKDWYDKLISKKFHLVTMTFLLWVIAILIGLFSCMSEKHSFKGPLPT